MILEYKTPAVKVSAFAAFLLDILIQTIYDKTISRLFNVIQFILLHILYIQINYTISKRKHTAN